MGRYQAEVAIMVKIGHVDMPDSWRLNRLSDEADGIVVNINVESTYDEPHVIGARLPRIRYGGFIQTSDSEAIAKLDALIEQFHNPDINYPLYINADEKYYFLLDKFTYERPGGFKNYWAFSLVVYWCGTSATLKSVYNNSDFTKLENYWGI